MSQNRRMWRARLMINAMFAVTAIVFLCMMSAIIGGTAYLLALGPEGIGRAIGSILRAMSEVSP